MGYSNIVIISSNGLDFRIKTLFAVDKLLESGVRLEYWNVSDLTYKAEVIESNVASLNTYVIETIKDFEERVQINRAKDFLYIVYMNYCYATYACYRALAKNKAHILYCVNGLCPAILTKSDWKRYFQHTLMKIWTRIANKTCLVAPAKYELLTSGKASLNYKTDKNTKVLRYNTTDYTVTMESMNESMMRRDINYVVFIDQYLPFHSDVKLTGVKNPQSEPYYSRLNLLFCKIEEAYNCKVFIAAHPASIKYKEHNYYEGREVFFGETGQLIKDSIGVLGHFSTAVAFPVIYKKKMIMLTSNEIKSNLYSYDALIRYGASQLFHCPLINIDDDFYDIHFGNVDEEVYDKYKYDYLTNRETEHIHNYETLLAIIEGRI